MTERKTIRLSSILLALLGSSLCASTARAAGAAVAVGQGGQLASRAQADSRAGQYETPARIRHTLRPYGRRETPAMAQQRLQQKRAAGTMRGLQSRSSRYAMQNANPMN